MTVPGMSSFQEPEGTLVAVNLLQLRSLPPSHGGQTSRPHMQNGGMARSGFKETGLMSIKNGILIIMVNGSTGNILYEVGERTVLRRSRRLHLYEVAIINDVCGLRVIHCANDSYSSVSQQILQSFIGARKNTAE
jgi:hypothetical protein